MADRSDEIAPHYTQKKHVQSITPDNFNKILLEMH